MSVWFILWFLLSAILLYFLGWTLFILYRQKQGWKSYAQKKKLRYSAKNMFASPEINGVVDGYTFEIFTGEHISDDARGTRKLAAFEVTMTTEMPISGAVASAGMVDVARGVGFKEQTVPEYKKWDASYFAASESNAVLESYLTPARLDALTALMRVKNAWVIFIFKDDTVLLRFDTADPIYQHKKLNTLITKMVEVASILELKDGEAARLNALKATPPKKKSTTKSAAAPFDAGDLELELEEDGGSEASSDDVPADSDANSDSGSDSDSDSKEGGGVQDSAEGDQSKGGEKPSTEKS